MKCKIDVTIMRGIEAEVFIFDNSILPQTLLLVLLESLSATIVIMLLVSFGDFLTRYPLFDRGWTSNL